MKRWIWFAVLLTLLLCGCDQEPQTETTVLPTEATVMTEPTEPTGLYEPGTDPEVLSGGAVRAYPLNDHTGYDLITQGSDVLLFSGVDTTTLTRFSGDNLYITASAQLECYIDSAEPSFQVSDKGITYYDAASRNVIFLDNDLKEVSRLQVPEDLVGSPILSANRLKLYYCTAEAVRVLDLETGLDRVLKFIAYPEQNVVDLLMNDTILRCVIYDEHGTGFAVYLSTETGELVWDLESHTDLTTEGDRYYTSVTEGSMELWLFGTAGGAQKVLSPADPFADVWYQEDVNGAVTLSSGSADYYDLESGLRTASVDLSENNHPMGVDMDAEGGYVYLLCHDDLSGQPVIYRWELSETEIADIRVYTGPRYTLENPDVTGLAGCAEQAAELSEQYGVEILVGMDAAMVQPWDYELEPEYQVPIITRDLQKLARLLETFPEGFFEELSDTTICLVRGINGSTDNGSLAAASGVQYWIGDKAYVALAAGDSLEKTFYHELFHVIDTEVLSETNAYYDWEFLNPEGFEYDMDYMANLERVGEEYLQDESRAFIDAYSMSYPKEDRARVMEYACMAGNESYFQSETMQEKLRTLCLGIRKAFDLRQYPNVLLWEQYLEDPVTP